MSKINRDRIIDYLARSSNKMEVFNLCDYAIKQDNWVIGSPPKVPKDSPGFSQSIQISYHYKDMIKAQRGKISLSY